LFMGLGKNKGGMLCPKRRKWTFAGMEGGGSRQNEDARLPFPQVREDEKKRAGYRNTEKNDTN